jgi:cell fate regulator YaaT (PSP1 superfamily)
MDNEHNDNKNNDQPQDGEQIKEESTEAASVPEVPESRKGEAPPETAPEGGEENASGEEQAAAPEAPPAPDQADTARQEAVSDEAGETEAGATQDPVDAAGGNGAQAPDEKADEGTPAVRTVAVKIKGQNRTSHFNAGEHTLKPGDEVVIKTEKGKALGTIIEAPMELSCRGCEKKKILRKASPEEINKDAENRGKEKEAYQFCAARIEEWELPMRLVKVEFLLDRSKAIFYFTSEKRVDFRELVRTLAKEFSTRIEMRQIGIRDEAKLVGGVGPCGMAFCCSSFLTDFAPISVKMAKEQNVILNPNKISGGCGRLLCCLNYEYEQYRDVSRGLPKIGKKVNLPDGSGRVRSIDIFTNTITIDMPDNKNITMDIEEFREKMK